MHLEWGLQNGGYFVWASGVQIKSKSTLMKQDDEYAPLFLPVQNIMYGIHYPKVQKCVSIALNTLMICCREYMVQLVCS